MSVGNDFHRPKTVTIVAVDHLGYLTFLDTKQPSLRFLRAHGAVGLVSPGLARFPNAEENQWASFTAGDVVNTKNQHAGLLERQLLANAAGKNVTIINFGDAGVAYRVLLLDKMLGNILAQVNGSPAGTSAVILCGITPPQNKNLNWDQLMPIAVYTGTGLSSSSTLTSPTTRTTGLVALRDLSPTILDMVGAPIPPSMTGAPFRFAIEPHRDGRLNRMFTITRLGQKTIVPFCWFLGIAAMLAVGGGARAVTVGAAGKEPVVCYLLRLVLASPLALLIAPCFPVLTVGQYMTALVGIDLLLAVISSPGLLIAATSVVILIDGATGSRLIAATVVSGFWLSGIRFYGIGNEYMGILIGMSLLTPALLLQSNVIQQFRKLSGIGVGLYFVLVIIVLSYPAFGAKAGGAVTSVVTFGLAWAALYLGCRPSWQGFVAWSICGFLLIFVLAVAAKHLHSPPSHIQTAVDAVHRGRLGYIGHIALRKSKMAVKTVLTPGGIVGLAAIVPSWIFWRDSTFKTKLDDFLSVRNDLSSALRAGGWGLAAALLFNDSGGVACLFFFGAMALVLLHEMVRFKCGSSRSMSAT